MFWNFGGQNHKISKIRDSHLVELVILRLSCVLYAFTFNSLSFMDSQTIATFGSEIACSDVTKTLIAPKFRFDISENLSEDGSFNLWQLLKVWRSCAALNRSYNSAEKVGAFNAPPPLPASRELRWDGPFNPRPHMGDFHSPPPLQVVFLAQRIFHGRDLKFGIPVF